MSGEEHVTYTDALYGVIMTSGNLPKASNITVRYSVSNFNDTISFSNDKDCMIMVDVKELLNIINMHRSK